MRITGPIRHMITSKLYIRSVYYQCVTRIQCVNTDSTAAFLPFLTFVMYRLSLRAPLQATAGGLFFP
jgi:hypothetical protein